VCQVADLEGMHAFTVAGGESFLSYVMIKQDANVAMYI
jgi:hypothetical protein